MQTDLLSHSSDTPVPEQRRTPRLQVLGEVYGHAVSFDLPLTLRDISFGGFSIEGPIAFPPGAAHDFRFLIPDAVVELRAVVVHQLRVGSADRPPTYLVGMRFLNASEPDVEPLIRSLVETLAV